jgi:hypothetical protein
MIDYHRGLIADETRTVAFREAIQRVVRPGDVVVDIGAGTGLLSFFACQAGASRVFAIDRGHAADTAALLVRQNGLGDRITVIHASAAETELPQRADVLITETLGAFALEEGILGIVLDARRRLLRPGAAIVPAAISLFAAPVEAPGEHARHIGFWTEPRYGIDFSPLATFASNTILTVDFPPAALLAPPQRLTTIELASVDDTTVSGACTFQCSRPGLLHGFAGWFAATLAPGVHLTNAPPNQTGWQQAFLALEQPLPVAAGETIRLDVETANGASWRWRGMVESDPPVAFDQTTRLANPPCVAAAKR